MCVVKPTGNIVKHLFLRIIVKNHLLQLTNTHTTYRQDKNCPINVHNAWKASTVCVETTMQECRASTACSDVLLLPWISRLCLPSLSFSTLLFSEYEMKRTPNPIARLDYYVGTYVRAWNAWTPVVRFTTWDKSENTSYCASMLHPHHTQQASLHQSPIMHILGWTNRRLFKPSSIEKRACY